MDRATTSRISSWIGRLRIGRRADARGKDTLSGIDPFIMQADGKAWLFSPSGLQEGPLPTHYEPLESVIQNPLYGQQCNPVRLGYERPRNPMHRPFRRRTLSLRADHLPADRAPHGGRHVAMALLAERIAAGDVLRSLAGTGAEKGSEERRLGDHRHSARRIEAGCW